VIYVTDEKGRLLDDVRLQSLVLAPPDKPIAEIEDRQLLSIPATADISEVVQTFEKYDRVVLPVTDSGGVLVGIITVDDVLDVAEEEATEDIQNLGGSEALDAPYLDSGVFELIRKRVGWLFILFIAQMLTATVMAGFEDEIAKATVLALFVPLIVSSGGNSGSQATSIIIRAMGIRELGLKDWWRVLSRELFSGLMLGLILGAVGLIRVLVWPTREKDFGEHFALIGVTVAVSLVGVVLLGNLCGSMLPFLLRRLGLDPAKASAPFVATVVDVTGLLIYFSVATTILKGTLL
jgi:magnesium transporter